MKRSALFAAFLATTALTPKPAEAAPVVAFTAGLLGIAGGSALAATAAYGAAAAFAGTFWGGFLVKTVLSVGLSAIAAKLAQKSPNMPPPAARMANYAQPISYAEWVFGRTRKGGPLGFTGFKSLRRYYVPILAAHEIEGFVEHWLDERVTGLTSSTDPLESNIDTYPMSNDGRIDTFTGAPGQTADPGLVLMFPEITEEHDFAGLAGAVVSAWRPAPENFSLIYPRGREWAYAPVIDGNNQIFDPRDGTRKYTNNAALVIAYWLTEILGREVDWPSVETEARASDGLVMNAQGEMQPRWTINGTISDEQEFEDQRAQLAGACDAFMYERPDGKVGFYVGRWIEPTITLTADDFTRFELSSGGWGGAVPDEVAAIYTEPENAWRETPSGAWVHRSVTKPIRDEPPLYLVTNHNQATRLNRRLARMKNAKYRLQGTVPMIGHELIASRFFRVIHSEMGVDAYFEVGEWVREATGVFSVTATSVDPSDFADDVSEPARPVYNDVVSNDDIPDVEGIGAVTVDGGAIDISWTATDESYSQQVNIRATGETDWQVVSAADGKNSLRITGLIDGQEYEYQVRNRTPARRVGAWKPDTPNTISVVANSTAPAALAAFNAGLAGADVDVTLTAPNDANYFATRIYRSTGSTDFGDAVLVRTEYGIPSNADEWTDVAPGSGAQRYWAEPINQSGVAGPRSGPSLVNVP